MSLIVTVWTNEGIVMGSDSRISFSSQLSQQIPVNIQKGHYFDTQEKTFLCQNGCGISTCGDASLFDIATKANKNITGYIYNYIDTQVTNSTSVFDTANNLKTYIMNIDKNAIIHFIVAGYNKNQNGLQQQEVYSVITGQNNSISTNLAVGNGAQWDGEIDTLSRIMKNHLSCQNPIQVSNLTLNGQNIGDAYVIPANQSTVFNENMIGWNLITLQDAIDFVRYAINTTIDTMRFTNVTKTVGGPIDILVIKPQKSLWISHKKLH